MRPPTQPTALQQNEGYHQVHVHSTPAPHQSQLHSPVSIEQPKQLQEFDQEKQQTTHKAKLQPLELLVEHKLSYRSVAAAAAAAVTYQPRPAALNDSKQQLFDLTHSSQLEAGSQAPTILHLPLAQPEKRISTSQISRSPSSEVCRSAQRASIFDDAAENFVINFPADSTTQQILPLSETVPLLTHIEATVVDKQRSIRLNKNSASLIFTKKELGNAQNHKRVTASVSRRQHHSLYGLGECTRKQTKHLPPTRIHQQRQQQHQRRSLQLNYNNNLVTSASCAASVAGTPGSAGDSSHSAADSGKIVLHKHHPGTGSALTVNSASATGTSARKQHSYSWYAPVYSALEEELEQESRDSSPLHKLANTKHISRPQQPRVHSATHAVPPPHDVSETVALLETRSRINIADANTVPLQRDAGDAVERKAGVSHSLSLHENSLGGGIGGDVEGSLGLAGGQLPRRRRLENFLKSLVGLKGSVGRDVGGNPSLNNSHTTPPSNQRPSSPEIRITRTPSEQDVVVRDPAGRQSFSTGSQLAHTYRNGSTSSLNVVQQKLWHMVRREGSASSLHQEKSQSIVQYTGLRKCETVLALTRRAHSLCAPSDASMAANSTGSGIFSAGGVEQIRPLNRLRNSVNSINAATCSRCSSILSLAASGSRYSLANGFVSSCAAAPPQNTAHSFERRPSVSFNTSVEVVDQEPEPHINVNAKIRLSVSSNSPPSNVTTATLHSNSNDSSSNNNNNSNEEESSDVVQAPTPTNTAELGAFGTTHAYPLTVSSLLSMATANHAAQACCVRDGITLKRREMLASADVTPSVGTPQAPFQSFTCKLCLVDVDNVGEATMLVQCGCQFGTDCMRAYVEYEILEGAYEISCPDAKCPAQGAITLPEIANLTTTNLLKKHHRFRLNREIELDKTRTWCPRAGCETICVVGSGAHSAICHIDESPSTSTTSANYVPHVDATGLSVAVQCPSCKDEFCALCKKAYHPNISCEEFGRRLIADGDDIGIPFDNELIKCCPMCAVPIEKDEGCAQMMCKRCKHVFCWYCLASLDDDFLLRHYDKGPCKNKLGHSRASVVWHRAQVIGIFAGFGILLLVASPLLLLAAPCIICCKCRGCSGSKIDEADGDLEEEVTALQG
ncbi:uncharacterized protein LOC115628490 [Scaptodrosophila lebanonensis]|uniref:E3 ubiquitin-protein ligase RNF144B n=1 Tax=Drosophila lebanonensis TaxID=7225 RepID=A0A6J2TZ80_DROLE|nr:uncharacterized protein LOC115628490 [Scaptodrosophila lebanonensis]XP_030380493.1 uncharacterized protein LOC115628490 [Scaptodrosophila lebanonensis]